MSSKSFAGRYRRMKLLVIHWRKVIGILRHFYIVIPCIALWASCYVLNKAPTNLFIKFEPPQHVITWTIRRPSNNWGNIKRLRWKKGLLNGDYTSINAIRPSFSGCIWTPGVDDQVWPPHDLGHPDDNRDPTFHGGCSPIADMPRDLVMLQWRRLQKLCWDYFQYGSPS